MTPDERAQLVKLLMKAKRHLAAHKSPLNLRDKVSAMRHVTTFIEDNPDGATE